MHVLHRTGKQGLGAAYLAGFAWAREHGYDVVVEMDADGSHAPEQLPRLLAALENADLVLGSRWVDGGQIVNWPKSRELLSRGGNAYTRIALGMPIKDATGGYRAYRRRALDQVLDRPGRPPPSPRRATASRSTWPGSSGKAGRRVVEVPITFVERERGESKMSRAIVVEALWRVTGWGVRHRLGRGKRSLTMPLLLLVVFIVVPLAELWVLIQVGQAIGVLPTIAACCWPTPCWGPGCSEAEGRKTWQAFRLALVERRLPAVEVADGASWCSGARCCSRPGFVTDVLGVLCLLPPTRAVLRRSLTGPGRHAAARGCGGAAVRRSADEPWRQP